MQPDPIPNDSRPVWELVIEDMKARDRLGRAVYGTPLQVGNGRDSLRDALDEVLDLAVYLRKEIIEQDAMKAELSRLVDILHKNRLHPDYEYTTTECGRKQFDGDEYMVKDGWESNVYGGDYHSCWERFDYHEEHHWRRLKSKSSEGKAGA